MSGVNGRDCPIALVACASTETTPAIVAWNVIPNCTVTELVAEFDEIVGLGARVQFDDPRAGI